MSWNRRYVFPLAGVGGDNLQPPLRREEERERADVGVHVLADFEGGVGGGGVVQEDEVGF